MFVLFCLSEAATTAATETTEAKVPMEAEVVEAEACMEAAEGEVLCLRTNR